jgi:hypothetical protein
LSFQAQERRSHRLKPGESVSISATTEEIYHEEFRDLSKTFGKDVAMNCWDTGSSPVNKQQLKLMEILTGQVRLCESLGSCGGNMGNHFEECLGRFPTPKGVFSRVLYPGIAQTTNAQQC